MGAQRAPISPTNYRDTARGEHNATGQQGPAEPTYGIAHPGALVSGSKGHRFRSGRQGWLWATPAEDPGGIHHSRRWRLSKENTRLPAMALIPACRHCRSCRAEQGHRSASCRPRKSLAAHHPSQRTKRQLPVADRGACCVWARILVPGCRPAPTLWVNHLRSQRGLDRDAGRTSTLLRSERAGGQPQVHGRGRRRCPGPSLIAPSARRGGPCGAGRVPRRAGGSRRGAWRARARRRPPRRVTAPRTCRRTTGVRRRCRPSPGRQR